MNDDFDTLINKLSSDIAKSLKTNLSIYVAKNEQNNEVVQQLRQLLFKLPEYKDLEDKYNKLKQQCNELQEKADPNILLDVSEVISKTCNNVTSDVKVIELNYLKNNVINKAAKAESEQEEEDDELEEEEDDDSEEDEEEDEKEEDEKEEDEKEEDEEAVEAVAEEEETKKEEAVEEAKDEKDEEDDEDEKDEKDEEDEEEDEEEEELELVVIDKKNYYKNELNNDIYECLDDEEIGELVGKLVNGKIHR